MKAVLAVLRTVPGIAGLLAALLLAVVVWFFAPPLLGVSAWWALALLAAVPVLVWVVVVVLLARRANRRDAALVAGATQVDEAAARAQASADAARSEEATVATRLGDALRTLKAAGGGKGGYLYERPWYLLIGPPGSGKTTAIRNSGLHFPLAEGRVSGVGGTRNCDWWISEQAVLIDTAGRYTTQDSDAQVDKAGWQRFLDLLRRERAQQPLNGVIVAFGVDLLCRLDATTREQHARAVRQRVRELEQRLGQRLPVYLLVSKSDLVAGFTEFFDDLDGEGRRQVWGITFPAEPTVEGHAASLRSGFAALVRRVQDRLLERLQAERGAEQRAAIAGFPGQFASLEEPLAAFVQAAFGGSSLDPAPFLRGLYFTSGTQEGTPIDRLTGALARTFGLDARRPAAVMGQKGRSYFLGRLLLDVVFNEARLAVRDRASERRRRLAGIATIAVSALALLGGVAWGWHAVSRENARAAQVDAAMKGAATAGSQLAAAQPLDRVSPGDDVAAVLPYLQQVRQVAGAASGPAGGLGLGQEARLADAGDVAYAHALDRVLLPRLLARLEGQMRALMQKPSELYLATRVYLMLGRLGPLDASLVQGWMQDDWARAYPGMVNGDKREQLAAHLAALLGRHRFHTYEVDGALVDSARVVFSHLPVAERVYERVRRAASDAPAWRPADVLGTVGQQLFARRSGQPLAEAAVPGVFTVEGLYRGFLPALPQAIKDAGAESWVLGPQGAAATADPVGLEKDVLLRYARDYAASWQAMLDDLELAPLGPPVQAARALNLLGAPGSPMRELLRSIARQLSPGTPPAAPGAAVASAAASAAAALPLAAKASAAAGLAARAGLSPAGTAAAAAVVAGVVEPPFRALREVPGPAIEPALAALNQLYEQVARVASSAPGAGGAAPAAGLDAGQRLQAEAERAPEPLARWLKAVNQSSTQVRVGGAKASLAAAAGQSLKPFCNNVEARFPFKSDPAAIDMPMGDFTRLFGANGALEAFFAQNLRELVDTRGRTWQPVSVAGAPAPVTATDVAQFQRAAAIHNAFFPPPLPGQASGTLRFELTPVGGTGGRISIDGAPAVPIPAGAARGRPLALSWPAAGRLTLEFEGEPPASAWTFDGPWAALRFVQRARLAEGFRDRGRLVAQQGARSIEFELVAPSTVNPFNLPELALFRCPRLGS